MCWMRTTEESGFHDALRTDVRLHQNNLEFHERLFLHERGKMLLHKQLRINGL